MNRYLDAINDDRCPDALAALAILAPILAGILAALALMAQLAR